MNIYNTLGRKTERFAPSGDVVKMYVCGITPYSRSHIGHALKAVIFDVLRRFLEYQGYVVKHVENFTDIDDKMIAGAQQQGVTINQLADSNIDKYLSHMDALNVLRAHIYPKATDEIPEMIEIIEDLVDKGAAYVVGSDVYFSVRHKKNYGKLSRQSLESMLAGARVEIGANKHDDMDFALWKSQKPGEPAWDSPWGPGRPGWHIECSAMSLKYLGDTIDIHGGGQELIFPHHENEIAQSETHRDGIEMSKFWIHNGLLMMGKDKMSKSLGNLVTVEDALELYSPDALRLFFLSGHYRSPLVYTEDLVTSHERAAERLRNASNAHANTDSRPALLAEPFRQRFIEAMADDLNTPRALAALFDLAHEINRHIAVKGNVYCAQDTLKQLSRVLGLTLDAPTNFGDVEGLSLLLRNTYLKLKSSGDSDMAGQIVATAATFGMDITSGDPNELTDMVKLLDLLIEIRARLRKTGRFNEADGIRSGLDSLGYVLEDNPDGTSWKKTIS